MPRYKMVVMTRPVAGREAEYNDWYQQVHLPEMVALPGFRAAQRFRLARSMVEGEPAPYLALYDIDTDDIDAVLKHLTDAAGAGLLTMSEARDPDRAATFASIYEEFGAVVSR